MLALPRLTCSLLHLLSCAYVDSKLVIPVNRAVDKKKINGKNGETRRRRGMRGC
jgi:hypothetical protein